MKYNILVLGDFLLRNCIGLEIKISKYMKKYKDD